MTEANDGHDWKPVTETDPPQGVVVLTRIDDWRGPRNEARLLRHGRLWFLPDMSMYVYYEPTEFVPLETEERTWTTCC